VFGGELLNFLRNIYTIVLLITIIVSVFYFFYAYKRREMPGAKNFILILISVLIYNGAYIFELNSETLSQALFWYNIEHIAIPIQPYLWLLISLDFIDNIKQKHTAIRVIALIHPITYYIVFFTNKFHHLYDVEYTFKSNGYFNVITSEKGYLFNIVVVTGTILAFYI